MTGKISHRRVLLQGRTYRHGGAIRSYARIRSIALSRWAPRLRAGRLS